MSRRLYEPDLAHIKRQLRAPRAVAVPATLPPAMIAAGYALESGRLFFASRHPGSTGRFEMTLTSLPTLLEIYS